MRLAIISLFIFAAGSAFAMSNEDAAKCDQKLFSPVGQKLSGFLNQNESLTLAVGSDVKNKIESFALKSSTCDELEQKMLAWSDEFLKAGVAFTDSLKVVSSPVKGLSPDEAQKCDSSFFQPASQQIDQLLEQHQSLLFGISGDMKTKLESLAGASTTCEEMGQKINAWGQDFLKTTNAFLDTMKVD